MPAFAIKTAPAGDKLRGGYYTPDPIASFLASWVAEAGPKLLEPSAGDGQILRELAAIAGPAAVTGVELFEDEASAARERSSADVEVADFFDWFIPEREGTYDGVAGNPPFIRFGSWDEPYRENALRFMRSKGMKPTKLTNAWVPFVVGALAAVREGGRVGLVLPAELLQVSYAASLRAYIVDHASELTIVSFKKLVFPGILQEVVLLLAVAGKGPATIATAEVNDAAELAQLDVSEQPASRAPLHESEKWTKYFLELPQIKAIRSLRADPRLQPLHTYASVDVGVVTGRNAFFCLTATDARERKIYKHTIPIVTRSQQVQGLSISKAELAALEGPTTRTRLLDLDEGVDLTKEKALAAYIQAGEDDEVQTGYKCRIRRNWWKVPSVWVPDGFMLRQISTHPRMTNNAAGATSTDTVHRVKVAVGVSMPGLATVAFNSVTFAMSEIVGRSYGGGILELEPSEAEELPVPDPSLATPDLIARADELVKEKRIEEALDLVDTAILIDALGFKLKEVQAARRAWTTLSGRRASRGKK